MSEMSGNVLDNPSVKWDPGDIPGWRREQFSKLGFSGAGLLDFLAESHIDVRAVEGWIAKGASPLDAVRLEAGKDHAGDDASFDHRRFDTLVRRWRAQSMPAPDPGRTSLLFGNLGNLSD